MVLMSIMSHIFMLMTQFISNVFRYFLSIVVTVCKWGHNGNNEHNQTLEPLCFFFTHMYETIDLFVRRDDGPCLLHLRVIVADFYF